MFFTYCILQFVGLLELRDLKDLLKLKSIPDNILALWKEEEAYDSPGRSLSARKEQKMYFSEVGKMPF